MGRSGDPAAALLTAVPPLALALGVSAVSLCGGCLDGYTDAQGRRMIAVDALL